MAVKFTSVECPSCGAHLSVEEGREKIFCEYCGTQIIVTNENEHTYRQVDEAAIKRAETERMVRLKELEMEEKEENQNRKSRKTAHTVAVVLGVIGSLTELVFPANLFGLFMIVIAFLVWDSDRNNQKRRTRRYVLPSEVQVTKDMTRYWEKNYNDVAALFCSAGFSNVQTVAKGDLNFLTAKKNGQVESVSINGKTGFKEGGIFQKDARVIITYHSTR